MNFHVHSCDVPANCFSQGWTHLCCFSSLWVRAAMYGDFVLGELHVQPSFTWTTHALRPQVPPLSLWPFWSLFPVLKVPGQSPEVHLSGRSKAQRGRGRGFHDSKPRGRVCPLYSCVFIAIPGTTFLVLVLQSFFKVVGEQASFCRGQCLPRVFAPSPSNYKVQHYVLSPMAILSSLPFSCHPSRYRTMNHRWHIPVFVL